VLLLFCLVVQPGWDHIQQLDLSVPVQALEQKEDLPQLITKLTVPIYTDAEPAETTFPNVTATAVYIMDRKSGSILFQKNAHELRYPASTAKMMTALVARRLYSSSDILTVQEEAFSTGSTVGFHIGEQLTVEQLLYALLIPSGNDAAFILANHHPEGYSGFISAMNSLAQELRLTQTTFHNPSGLDNATQMTTARDLALIANEVMKDAELRKIVLHKQYTIHDVQNAYTHELQNTDELLGNVEGVVGIKTGTTDLAGENLVTEVDRNGREVIIVVLGSHDRFSDSKQIINWVFSHYSWKNIDAQVDTSQNNLLH